MRRSRHGSFHRHVRSPYRRRVPRSRDDDACPGALQVHQAADGALARVRLPGGMIEAYQLEALALVADRFGSSTMELTSRGNVQIRGVTDPTALADAIADAGLLPSEQPRTRPQRRGLAADRTPRRPRGRPRPGAPTSTRRSRPASELATLPGRFWFAVDDGRGDVSGLGADVGAHLLDDRTAALLVAGVDTGIRTTDVVPDARRRGGAVQSTFAEPLGGQPNSTDVEPLLAGLSRTAEPGATWPAVTRPPVGWIQQDDGRITLGGAVPLGVLQGTGRRVPRRGRALRW